MKMKPIKQKNSIACGPTSISMVVNYFGDKINFKRIEEISRYKKTDGMTDEQIAKTLTELGYRAEVKEHSSWEELQKLNKLKNTAVIVSWMKEGYKGHVSALEKITDKHIFLADPDIGKILKIEKVKFMRLWMEYDGLWWPRTNRDINLRTIIKVAK